MKTTYTFGRRVRGTPAELRPAVEAALKSEGFGVITEIDLAAALRSKIGVERAPYLILGACNPQLAYRATEIDESVGTLLPCNVVLRADGASTIIEAIDPVAAMQIAASPRLLVVAKEARDRLVRAVSSVRDPALVAAT